MILTVNERRLLRFLATSIRVDHSMNEIAKMCGLTPNGAYKMLTKLERCGVLKAKPIANLKVYSLDFGHEKTSLVLELAFIPDNLEGRVRLRTDDLKPLQAVADACILFGSYITTKKEPGDLDVMFVLKQTEYAAYKRALASVQELTPLKIQDVVQTTADLLHNIKKNDPIVTAALREGVVVWGSDVLVKVIKNAAT